jgi:predicted Rossmann fold flavoprotein
MIYNLIIIGGGPAGLMAAITAGNFQQNILILEAGNKCGRKLLSTGGGRCNFTHLAPMDDLINKYGKNKNFIKSALYEFPPPRILSFFQDEGIDHTIDEKNCAFPKSNKALDILNCLIKCARDKGITISTDQIVKSVNYKENIFEIRTGKEVFQSKKLIIATGGLSYPETGSTGDGYKLAHNLGHNIMNTLPGLIPLVIKNNIFKSIAGVSIPNIEITSKTGKKNYCFSGDLLFTHSGISGPVVFDLSSDLSNEIAAGNIEIYADFLPEYPVDDLERFILHKIVMHPHQKLNSLFASMLPHSAAEIILGTALENAGLEQKNKKTMISDKNKIQKIKDFNEDSIPDINLPLKNITAPIRKQILEQIKHFRLIIQSSLPIEQATVTIGGIDTREINKNTMESKILNNLFFAGEIIDVDGKCGGYNLQMCWSTGYLAGKNASLKQ